MAVVAGQSSPSSLQLRLGLGRRKSCPTYLQIRFPASSGRWRRVRLAVARSLDSKGGDGEVSPSEAGESKDPFAGWFGEDSEEDSPQKGKFRGFVGVGLAGMFFVAGITFAATSIWQKKSGPREMKPLTGEEEVLLISDEQNSIETEDYSTASHDSEADNTNETISSSSTIDPENNVPGGIDAGDIGEASDTDSSVKDRSISPASDSSDSSEELTDSTKITPDSDKLDGDLPDGDIISGEFENSKNLLDSDEILGDSSGLEKSVETDANPQESTELDHIEYGNDSSVTNSLSEPNSPSEDLDTDEQLKVNPLESQLNTSEDFETTGVTPKSTLPLGSFSSAGIPAPSLASTVSQVSPEKIIVPAAVDQVQGQALAALKVLKVIEADIEPGDICSRREYARWLVVASSILSRNTASKVYPAMYIENVTELAFDDVTPEDPDFPFIQGLAEAGLISSKLSSVDLHLQFSPESPVSRQDLVSWKMALERRQLPDVDRKILLQSSGYIDIDRINPEAWPAIVADLSSREHGIIPLAFGYTRLFQPHKPVTKAQAAIALTTCEAAEIVGEELARIEAESMADSAVAAHTALVAQVEEDLNASFERELAMEKQKAEAVEKLAEEAKLELEKLRREREEENNSLIRSRAAVESEMEILSKMRNELDGQLQNIMSNKMEMAFEKERILNLRREAEKENEAIGQLQYELEVERKALSMARAWAEEEAKRASEQAKTLEEARERWERHGLKVVVEGSLREDELAERTWLKASNQSPLQETIDRGESLLEKIVAMAAKIKGKSAAVMERIIQIMASAIAALKRSFSESSTAIATRAGKSMEDSKTSIQELQQSASGFFSGVKDGAKKAVEEGLTKVTHRFKT